ncbi:polysaccharide export protein [Palleronia sediminis]|uniref:Polysaccharide export protein n=1 Tax=Palleronia sediminis TaxID=2547833 RepID=A0A4R6ACT0_9RHOB|nr:polysaccharide biosynthesis/export family protein [Palleronia sediminis]TDL81811.1 polysaccharide export protein [Palleronia sediminis]
MIHPRFGLAVCALAISILPACAGLPRGAAMRSEINLNQSEAGDYAYYEVTRATLPRIASWPSVNPERSDGWPKASAGSIGQVIQPGDTVAVRIFDSSENSLLTPAGARDSNLGEMMVSPSGSVFIPYVGNVKISGMSPQKAREAIQYQLGLVAPSAQVQLALTEGLQNSVNIVSGVSAPGVYPLKSRNVTVLGAIGVAGGVASGTRNPRVMIQRGSALYAKSLNTLYDTPSLNALVHPGDTLIVEEDDRYFLALGAAGQEELVYFQKDTISALEAVTLMGGLMDSRADPEGVLILREYPADMVGMGAGRPEKQRVVFSIDLTSAEGLFSAQNMQIMPEDVVLATESAVGSLQVALALLGATVGLANQVN